MYVALIAILLALGALAIRGLITARRKHPALHLLLAVVSLVLIGHTAQNAGSIVERHWSYAVPMSVIVFTPVIPERWTEREREREWHGDDASQTRISAALDEVTHRIYRAPVWQRIVWAFRVNTGTRTGAKWFPAWFIMASWAVLLAGVGGMAFGLFCDRPRGRRRCPSCRYDMRRVEAPCRCPECGRSITSNAQLLKRHRRWRLTFVSLAAVLAAWPLRHFDELRGKNWTALVPTSVSIMLPGVPQAYLPDSVRAGRTRNDASLAAQFADDIARNERNWFRWQNAIFSRRVAKCIENNEAFRNHGYRVNEYQARQLPLLNEPDWGWRGLPDPGHTGWHWFRYPTWSAGVNPTMDEQSYDLEGLASDLFDNASTDYGSSLSFPNSFQTLTVGSRLLVVANEQDQLVFRKLCEVISAAAPPTSPPAPTLLRFSGWPDGTPRPPLHVVALDFSAAVNELWRPESGERSWDDVVYEDLETQIGPVLGPNPFVYTYGSEAEIDDAIDAEGEPFWTEAYWYAVERYPSKAILILTRQNPFTEDEFEAIAEVYRNALQAAP